VVFVLNKLVEKALRNFDKFVAALFVGPDGKPLRLTYYQKEFIMKALTRKPGKFIFLAATRSGKTTSTAVLAILYGLLYPREEIVVVAPTFRQANILFGRIREFIMSSPILMRMIDREKSFRHDLIHFKNKTVLRALSAGNPEALLGFGATVLIVDEAGSIPDNIFRTRILRMIMSNPLGRKPVLILLGTPHVHNYMWRLWVEGDEKEVFKMRVTWRDAVKAGIMRKDEVEFARKMLSETEFRMWYEAEFVNTEGKFFDIDDIRKCAVARGIVGAKPLPRRPGHIRILSVDVARLGDDETAAVIVEVPKNFTPEEGIVEVLGVYRRKKMYLNETIGWVLHLAEEWLVDYVAVDAIGMGVGVCDVLREKLGFYRVVDVSAAGRERIDMFMLFRRLARERRIILPENEDIVRQFWSYEVRYGGNGDVRIIKKAGYRDDVADAIIYGVWVGYKYSNYAGYTVHVSDKIANIVERMSASGSL